MTDTDLNHAQSVYIPDRSSPSECPLTNVLDRGKLIDKCPEFGAQLSNGDSSSLNSTAPSQLTDTGNPKSLTPDEKEWLAKLFETTFTQDESVFPIHPIEIFGRSKSEEISRRFELPGMDCPHMTIEFMNGISTTAEEAVSHLKYISSFVPEMTVGMVYNQSHGASIDLAEAVLLSHAGISINTKGLKQERWARFHEANKDRPNAKILEICHSKGGIDLKNALKDSPDEIRNRIIVVNLGAAATITRDLCFMRFNYACKDDWVNLGELILPSVRADRFLSGGWLDKILKDREDIIFLDPHPDTDGMGHGFQDPVFKKVLQDHIEDYMMRNGEYVEKDRK